MFKRKYYLTSALCLIILSVGAITYLKSNQSQAATQPKQTYQECINTAETNYKKYVDTHGTSSSNKFSEKFYSLSDDQEKMINSTRAAAYHKCFENYGEKLPNPR